ncbi:hypothetical protein TNCV_2549851 [Trichonephila clavipes]|nr:hypothetical protein TNCV_2549851 [Trichonephila clavipes]
MRECQARVSRCLPLDESGRLGGLHQSNHILECPTVATKLLKMGMVPLRDSLRELLYSPDAPRIAEAVIKTFDGI